MEPVPRLDLLADAIAEKPLSFDKLCQSFRSALQGKQYQKVLQCWESFKGFEQAPNVQLLQVVYAMQACKKDSKFIVTELADFFTTHPEKQDMSAINDLLEPLCRNFECHLVDFITDALPTLKDQRTYEMVLCMHVSKRNFVKAQRLVAEMRVRNIDVNIRILVATLTMAIEIGDVDETLSVFGELKAVWDSRSTWEVAPWKVREHKMKVLTQIVQLACKEGRLQQLLPQLEDMAVGEDAVNHMFTKCSPEHFKIVESIARANQAPLADSTYASMIKSLSVRPWRVRTIVNEAMGREGTLFSPELALAILDYCTSAIDTETAESLFRKMAQQPPSVAAAFSLFFAKLEDEEEEDARFFAKLKDEAVDVGPHKTKMAESAPSCNYTDSALSLLMAPEKVPRRRGRGNTDAIVKAMQRLPSPSGSTSAGTGSDSEGDGSADEWPPRAAFRPPPGLEGEYGACPPGSEAMLDIPAAFREVAAEYCKYMPGRLAPGGRL